MVKVQNSPSNNPDRDLPRGAPARTGGRLFWTATWVQSLAMIFTSVCFAADAGHSQCRLDTPKHSAAASPPVCTDPSANAQVRKALSAVCLAHPAPGKRRPGGEIIVIGFLGGFASRGDSNHPEVGFAKYLRQHYDSAVYAEVFSNHEAAQAMGRVLGLLDTDCDGRLTDSEKQRARIILYGHSWGASETVAFARELGKRNIPVLLTVQIDIVAKPGQEPVEIPSNVQQAVNFFQPSGPLHGRPRILALDPVRTNILGNFRMTYRNHPVDCRNFPWFARTFNKPHHEIENDSRVWEQVNSFIERNLGGEGLAAGAGSASD